MPLIRGEVKSHRKLEPGKFYDLYEFSPGANHIATLEILAVLPPGTRRTPICDIYSPTIKIGRVKSKGRVRVRQYPPHYNPQNPGSEIGVIKHIYLPRIGIGEPPLSFVDQYAQRLIPHPEPKTPEQTAEPEKPTEQYTPKPEQEPEKPEEEKPKKPKPRRRRKPAKNQPILAGFQTGEEAEEPKKAKQTTSDS